MNIRLIVTTKDNPVRFRLEVQGEGREANLIEAATRGFTVPPDAAVHALAAIEYFESCHQAKSKRVI